MNAEDIFFIFLFLLPWVYGLVRIAESAINAYYRSEEKAKGGHHD